MQLMPNTDLNATKLENNLLSHLQHYKSQRKSFPFKLNGGILKGEGFGDIVLTNFRFPLK